MWKQNVPMNGRTSAARGAEAASFCPNCPRGGLILRLDTIVMVSIFAILAAGLVEISAGLILLARMDRAAAPKRELLFV